MQEIPNELVSEFKAGFVTIIGQPNVGKSTLLNALLKEKLAITSPKVQTTRHRIQGVITTDTYQLVLVDTPGIITNPAYRLQEKMMKAVQAACQGVDLILLLLDATQLTSVEKDLLLFFLQKLPHIVVLNKMDLLSTEKQKTVIEQVQEWTSRQTIIPIAALHQIGLDSLLETIVNKIPIGHPFYDADTLTDKSTRFFVEELIREQIFHLFQEEIPYHTTVVIQQFEEQDKLTRIHAQVIVTRESQKGILLGHKGKAIRELGSRARKEIETFLEKKVWLELFIKVRPKWRDQDLYLNSYGY